MRPVPPRCGHAAPPLRPQCSEPLRRMARTPTGAAPMCARRGAAPSTRAAKVRPCLQIRACVRPPSPVRPLLRPVRLGARPPGPRAFGSAPNVRAPPPPSSAHRRPARSPRAAMCGRHGAAYCTAAPRAEGMLKGRPRKRRGRCFETRTEYRRRRACSARLRVGWPQSAKYYRLLRSVEKSSGRGHRPFRSVTGAGGPEEGATMSPIAPPGHAPRHGQCPAGGAERHKRADSGRSTRNRARAPGPPKVRARRSPAPPPVQRAPPPHGPNTYRRRPNVRAKGRRAFHPRSEGAPVLANSGVRSPPIPRQAAPSAGAPGANRCYL